MHKDALKSKQGNDFTNASTNRLQHNGLILSTTPSKYTYHMYLWLSLHYNKDKVRPIFVSPHVMHLVQTFIHTTATKTKREDEHTETLNKMKKLFFLFFTNYAQVLLASSFFSTLA